MSRRNSYDVLWPLGLRAAESIAPSQRPADLNDTVVCEVWDSLFRGNEIFTVVREELTKRYPGVRFVQYDQFGNTMGVHQNDVVANLGAEIRKHRGGAVISGIGA